MVRSLRRRESDRAGFDALAHEPAHRVYFFGSRRTLGGFFTHHVHAHGCVPDQRRHVDAGLATLDGVEVLGEGLEGPVFAEPLPEDVEIHALDVLQGAQDQVAVLRAGRRDPEAAVAHHHGGHAVPGRDREHAVPHHLGVVMGMEIDEAR